MSWRKSIRWSSYAIKDTYFLGRMGGSKVEDKRTPLRIQVIFKLEGQVKGGPGMTQKSQNSGNVTASHWQMIMITKPRLFVLLHATSRPTSRNKLLIGRTTQIGYIFPHFIYYYFFRYCIWFSQFLRRAAHHNPTNFIFHVSLWLAFH